MNPTKEENKTGAGKFLCMIGFRIPEYKPKKRKK